MSKSGVDKSAIWVTMEAEKTRRGSRKRYNMRVLVTIPAEPEHRSFLETSCRYCEFVYERQPSDEELEKAEAVVGVVPVEKLPICKKLRFLQLSMAGSDAYKGRMPEGTVLANASGAYGLAISEHAFAAMLMMMKKLNLYRDNQNEAVWRDEGGVTSVEGARVLIVGLGDIGGEFAKRCKAFGACCIGIRRTLREKPDYIDEMHTPEELDPILPTCDVVLLALPQSEETKRLFDERRLYSMKPGSILINVGRGSAIDTDALVRVLNDGRIKASVDVTDPEPLPPEHPLWKCRNILITPHISGFFHLRHTHDTIFRIAARNIAAFIAGEPIMNVVDPETGYRMTDNRY